MHGDTQDLDKKDAVAEKQRESMMVGLSKTKTELGSLQDALAKTQVELEKTNFELHAKKSKHMSPVPVSCCSPSTAPKVTSATYECHCFCWCHQNQCLAVGWSTAFAVSALKCTVLAMASWCCIYLRYWL